MKNTMFSQISRSFAALRKRFSFASILADSRGNVMLLSALAMPVLVGMAGLAIEGGNWYQMKRQMQNAADSAVIAAATNAGATRYSHEAKAVASQYGFTDGVNNTTVTASNTATCPSGGSTCYSVTITRNVSLVFSRLVGFAGSATVGTRPAIALNSLAVASRATVAREYCILALSTIGTALTSNGAPNADLNGCNTMSNSNSTCNGHDIGASVGDAAGTSNGCGLTQNSNVPVVTDPYAARASNIPTNVCGSHPQATLHNNGKSVTNANGATTLSGSYSNTGNWAICGDLVLSGNVTLTGSSVAIIIYNGDLLTNNYTILTASGAAATIIFSGSMSNVSHIPNTPGAINIKAPNTGVWSGVALYQDPGMTDNSGLDIDYRGNNPSTPVWNISGLVYLPEAEVSFSGAVNKATNGDACFALVINTLTINGNGSIIQQTGCATTGLVPPTNNISDRGRLVS